MTVMVIIFGGQTFRVFTVLWLCCITDKDQDQDVRSFVSLKKSLVEDILSLPELTKSVRVLILFLLKNCSAKARHIFGEKNGGFFKVFYVLKFNIPFTIEVVSFELCAQVFKRGC